MANASTSANPGQQLGGAQDLHSSFPSVKTTEIIQVLAELGLLVNADDIARPTQSVTIRCFMAFLDGLSGINQEWIEVRAKMVNQLDYREVFPDGMYWRIFNQELKELFVAAEVRDFVFSDVVRPQSKRFKRQLSGLINFWRFRSDRLQTYEEVVNANIEIEAGVMERRRTEEEMRVKLEGLIAKREAERDDVAQSRNNNIRSQETLMDLKTKQKKLMDDLDQFKGERQECIQKHTDLSYQAQLWATDIKKLNGRIISSPEELKGRLDQVQQQLQSDKVELATEERRARALESKREVMMALEMELKSCVTLLEMLEGEKSRITEQRAARDQKQDEIEQYQTEVRDFITKVSQIRRQIQSAMDRLQRLNKGFEEKRAAYQAKTEAIHAALSDLNRRRSEMMDKAKAKNQETAELEAKFDRITEEYQAFCNERTQERNTICHLAEVYIVGIARAREIPIDG
ncbi:unnamed protein product [Tilletia controversa]|uniref:Kinetochore protein NUF2 n=1 Tax=Tilletia controversa TaxID=13291 RepID=A0A8X7MY43_9BASI|nr:hypothetical protein CF328_g1060 [Tilletia controversa]KAE8253905.1 hypothetical protein A4X06_0g1159 [Tilletia controversa]CAD6905259.1 unnamed protein product [Tilletia controversa]CAD6911864.1 unnamed protein product [Tilletia controversa]CAD6947797.1 unnamed protein product [Tilletia controversa]